jgi:hypothetical protein
VNTTPNIPLALIKDDIITKAIHYLTVNEYLRMNTHLKNIEKKIGVNQIETLLRL